MHIFATDLPSADSPTVVLAQATEEEKLAQWRKNGVSWKGVLSDEAYLRREDHLAKQRLTRDGGLSFWVLVDSSCEPRRVLAGCESFKKKALVARNGRVEQAVAHGIGSVFCASEMRRRGYAARMLRDLGVKLRTWQTDQYPCLFSVLYSDIGKTFYSSLGWRPFCSNHVHMNVISTMNASEREKIPMSRPLLASDLAELCNRDEALMRQSMAHQDAKGKVLVAQVPNLETLQWHHAREEFVGKHLYGRVPKVKGAITGEKGNRVWCYWTRTWQNANEAKGNIFHILRITCEDETSINWETRASANPEVDAVNPSLSRKMAALFLAAQTEAKEWNMGAIESWEPSKTVLSAAKRISPQSLLIERDRESIPSLMWYGEASESPASDGLDQVQWIANEKYGWC